VTGYGLLIPEFLLIAGALWAMFAERLPGGDRGSAWLGALLSAGAAVAAALAGTGGESPFGTLLVSDGPARFARTAVGVLCALWLLWTASRAAGRVREAVALALFSATGALLMASANELITLVIAIELSTIPAYVLMGYRRNDVRGLEGALKYFLLSMLTSLVMLYGFSFVYGLTGTTQYGRIDLAAAGSLGMIAVLLSLVGMFAKLSAAPFHYWAPDAYEGAHPWSVAFVSTVPKVAGAIAVVRLLSALAPGVASTSAVVLAVAGASILLGNLGALTQTDVRRLMAYSGVAHSGYLLLGAAALTSGGFLAAVFYGVAYAVPSLGIMLVAAEEGPLVADFSGLSERRPATAWATVALLLSLIGIPPLVGFVGKFSLFTAALSRNSVAFTAMVAVAVAMSVVSAGFYLRIVRAMFTATADAGRESEPARPAASLALAVCVLIVFALGIAAGPVLGSLAAFAR
jgi:NADH-quinone oxidoreductase subunit N